jgi:hypothetical protein
LDAAHAGLSALQINSTINAEALCRDILIFAELHDEVTELVNDDDDVLKKSWVLCFFLVSKRTFKILVFGIWNEFGQGNWS